MMQKEKMRDELLRTEERDIFIWKFIGPSERKAKLRELMQHSPLWKLDDVRKKEWEKKD